MVDELSLADLDARLLNEHLASSQAYGHLTPDIRTQLLNDAQYEVFKLLIETYEEVYFCTMKSDISPTNGIINLDQLVPDRPFYKVIAFQKQAGDTWIDIPILGVREGWRQSTVNPECWYTVGRQLISDPTVSGTYRVAYHYRIKKMEKSNDVCEIPPEFVEMIPLCAAKRAAIRSRLEQDAAMFGSEFESRKREMKQAAQSKIVAKQMRVVDTEGYDSTSLPRPGLYVIS